MMAAAQPFLSGAISKTINLPNEATIEEIKNAYKLSWELGLKANALYRDGSKLSQPLNIKSDEELDNTEADDEENVKAAHEEIAQEAASGVLTSVSTSSPLPSNIEPVHTAVIEKIVERIVERPLRRRLPDTRNAINHKFEIAGHEGYLNVGLYEDGTPGEVFITMAKEGSTIGGLMDAIATLVSVSLQYGVPVESLVRKFEHVRFEPSGMTRNRDIPIAKSLVDYIFRWLAMEFVPGYREANAPQRAKKAEPAKTPAAPTTAGSAPARPTDKPGTPTGEGSGNGSDESLSSDAKPFDYGSGLEQQVTAVTHSRPAPAAGRLGAALDPLSQQGSEMQSDAPACDVCGSITVRSGTCYKCLNCGNSMGCS
jgi:ribonucleoside-diphosphate reductase alpha chain